MRRHHPDWDALVVVLLLLFSFAFLVAMLW